MFDRYGAVWYNYKVMKTHTLFLLGPLLFLYASCIEFPAVEITGIEFVNHNTCKISMDGNWQEGDIEKIKVTGRSKTAVVNYESGGYEYNRFKGNYVLWHARRDWEPNTIVRAILPGSNSGAEFQVPEYEAYFPENTEPVVCE